MGAEATMAILAPALCGDAGGRPLAGMVALVSGGGRGVGRLLGARLADAGAAVGLIARSPDELATAVGEISRAGGIAAGAAADVSDKRAAAAAVAELRRQLGPRTFSSTTRASAGRSVRCGRPGPTTGGGRSR